MGYYLCDARTGRPRTCALLGGNLRHSCLEWYDPGQCNFCEDRGRSLVCQVRGWDPDQRQWTKVPLHSMDVLGSFEGGDWAAKPLWATIELQKQVIRFRGPATLPPPTPTPEAGDGLLASAMRALPSASASGAVAKASCWPVAAFFQPPLGVASDFPAPPARPRRYHDFFFASLILGSR